MSEDGGFGADGIIDQTREVSFASWVDADSPEKKSDIRALAAVFDSDANGVLNDSDAHFADFRLWKDANHDGVTQDGELFTLSEMGIVSIGLASDSATQDLVDGTRILGSSSYTTNSGVERLIADVAFASSKNLINGGDAGWQVTIDRSQSGGYTVSPHDEPSTAPQSSIFVPWAASHDASPAFGDLQQRGYV